MKSEQTQENMKLTVLPQPLHAFSTTHTILRNLQRSMKPAFQHETSVPALCPPVRLLALSASVKRDLGSVCSHDVSSSLVVTEPTSNKRELFLLAEI